MLASVSYSLFTSCSVTSVISTSTSAFEICSRLHHFFTNQSHFDRLSKMCGLCACVRSGLWGGGGVVHLYFEVFHCLSKKVFMCVNTIKFELSTSCFSRSCCDHLKRLSVRLIFLQGYDKFNIMLYV